MSWNAHLPSLFSSKCSAPMCLWKWSAQVMKERGAETKGREGEKGEQTRIQVKAAERCSLSPGLTETRELFALDTEKRNTQDRQKITVPRQTSYLAICFAKQSNTFNSEVRGYPGMLSVSLTPIWTNQLGLYFWIISCTFVSTEAKHTSKNSTEAENRALKKFYSYKRNLRLMKKLLWNQEKTKQKTGKFP